MSIENSIDRLAAAIEKLADAVASPVVVHPISYVLPAGEVAVQPRPATEAEKAEIAAADAVAAAEPKKSRGRPKKIAEISAGEKKAELVVEETGQVKLADPQPAAAEPVTAAAGDQASSTSSQTTISSAEPAVEQATAEPVQESLTKTEIIQILTGLQKALEEKATSLDEKRAAAQRCREIIKSVVGTESLKDAKPEHFGKIKSAVQKVLNNE